MKKILPVSLCLIFLLSACAPAPLSSLASQVIDEQAVPPFSGEPFVAIYDNVPDFKESELVTQSYETYAPLDKLGRCGVAMACIGVDIMPTEERGSIGQVKPSGWQTVKYDHVDGKYLYNRCHLIGFQLTGENANEQNLITGTRYLNVEGMLPFENMIADYVKETKNHVLYRVTPVFEGDNLVASGVIMEAQSVEDGGEGIQFHVYAYNNQPGVEIDYQTGNSWADGSQKEPTTTNVDYVLNTNSKKIHLPSCSQVSSIKPENKKTTNQSKQDLQDQGYAPCKTCNP